MKRRMMAVSLVSLSLLGCSILPKPLSTTRSLLLKVTPINGPSTRAVVFKKTLADIARLEIIPFRNIASDSYAPISSNTGEPTTPEDPQIIKLVQSAPLNLGTSIALGGLRANTRYRIVAQAYDVQNNLISTEDAGSYLDVDVIQDDRPQLARIPLKLVDVPFSAKVKFSIDFRGPYVNRVEATLTCLSVSPNSQTNGPTLYNKPGQLQSFNFSNLRANSDYRVDFRVIGRDGDVRNRFSDFLTVEENEVISDRCFSAIAEPLIETCAGSGEMGFDGDGPALGASLNSPAAVAIAPCGAIYIADMLNNRIRKVEGGVMTTVVGNGQIGCPSEGEIAASTSIFAPAGVAMDGAGDLYVTDRENNRIYKISNSTGRLQTIAGMGIMLPSMEGPALLSMLGSPTGIVVDSDGSIYFCEQDSPMLRKITPDGMLHLVAGNGSPGDAVDVLAKGSTCLRNPWGIAVDPVGNIYIADSGFSQLRKITPDGTIRSFGTTAILAPKGVALDGFGNVYVSSGDGRVYCLDQDGNELSNVGPFSTPGGLARDAEGRICVADTGNHKIKQLY